MPLLMPENTRSKSSPIRSTVYRMQSAGAASTVFRFSETEFVYEIRVKAAFDADIVPFDDARTEY